jgi:anti-sigma factor RsiW
VKRFFKSCGRYRRNLCLLAGGALSGPEKAAMENHLAACADCRKYFDELQAVTAPLRSWEENFSRIQPNPTIQRQWARAVQTVSRPGPVRRLTPARALLDWWQEVIWSSRRVWVGLAAVWIVLLVVNLSGREQSPAIAKSGPSTAMIMALRDQQRILAELLPDNFVPPDTDRPKFFLPKPRTERMKMLTV